MLRSNLYPTERKLLEELETYKLRQSSLLLTGNLGSTEPILRSILTYIYEEEIDKVLILTPKAFILHYTQLIKNFFKGSWYETTPCRKYSNVTKVTRPISVTELYPIPSPKLPTIHLMSSGLITGPTPEEYLKKYGESSDLIIITQPLIFKNYKTKRTQTLLKFRKKNLSIPFFPICTTGLEDPSLLMVLASLVSPKEFDPINIYRNLVKYYSLQRSPFGRSFGSPIDKEHLESKIDPFIVNYNQRLVEVA